MWHHWSVYTRAAPPVRAALRRSAPLHNVAFWDCQFSSLMTDIGAKADRPVFMSLQPGICHPATRPPVAATTPENKRPLF